MASNSDAFDEHIENLKNIVKKSFTKLYAALKARELKTLRQLDVIRKQCQDNKDLLSHCIHNINISYMNETHLIENIDRYGVIDFEKLSFDNSPFLLEDYISPNDDHAYSYKTIGELTIDHDENLEAIQKAAFKQITKTDDCDCVVNIQAEEISRKFRDSPTAYLNNELSNSYKETTSIEDKTSSTDTTIDDIQSECSDADTKKIEPTDEWLNSIKSHIETEPSQVTDMMEHSTITCS